MATNMINDGTFDPEGFGAWTLSSAQEVTTESENNYYCQMAESASIEQQIYPAGGATYIVTFSSRSSDGGTVSVMDSYTGQTYTSQKFVASEDWVVNSMTFTSDASWGGPIVLHFTGTANGGLDIDNVVMVPVE